MIPLDQNFNELLNETIPFPLPKGSEKAASRVVPKPATTPKSEMPTVTAKPTTVETPPKLDELCNKQPEAPLLFVNSSFDCHPDAATEIHPFCHSVSGDATLEEKVATEQAPEASRATCESNFATREPRSKVEITAEPSVPFEIDTRMMINRPRLTLKESGLPIPFSPEEPDPSIVGESVLDLKRKIREESTLSEPFDQELKAESKIPEEIIDLIEHRTATRGKPLLKAFNPEEKSEEKRADEVSAPQETTSEACQYEACQYDKAIDEYLYENACEIDDDFEEHDELAEETVETAEITDKITETVDAAEIAETTEAAETVESVETSVANEIAEETFLPMLQVDRYAWPEFCLDMHPIIKTQLGHLADQLNTKSTSARNVIAVVGSGPKSGSTSILLGLATALKAAGQRVAIVDANINTPNLASSLGLQPEQGWETVLSGKFPIQESLIDSIEDQIALLPLCLDESQKLTFGVRPTENERMSDAITKMKEHYDLILVDLGSPKADDIAAFSNMSEWIDSAVVVHNLRDGSRGQLIKAKNLMRDYGVSVAGIAENFAPREACFEEPEQRAA